MSPEIYKAIYEKVLHKESKEPNNLCCVCLQTFIGDEIRSVHDETEFILNSGIVMVEKLSQVLKYLIGESFSDVLNTICHKCKDSAITSYSFILSSRESTNVLLKAIQHLEICFMDTPESILQKCKSMYVDINLNAETSYMIKRYYDKKHNESLKDAFDRILMITQHQKPITNLPKSEDEDPLANFGSDYDIGLSSSAGAELAKILKPKGLKYFNCSDCNAGFNSLECFTKHRTSISKCASLKNQTLEYPQGNNHPCHICGKRFSSADNPDVHVKHHHMQCDNNTPKKAPEKIKNPNTNLAMSKDKDEILLAVFGSDQIRSTKEPESAELQNSFHQQENVSKPIVASQNLRGFKYFNCPDCKAGFNSPELYQRHRTAKKKCTSRNRGYFPCNQCNFSAVYKHQLRYHVQVKHLGIGVVCENCGKVFRSKTALKTHQLSHSADNRFVCPICGKNLRSVLSLKNHTALHTGEKNYLCHICGERFRSAPNRREHLFRHHVRLKPVQCEICQKEFKYKGDYLSHKKKHFSKDGSLLVDKTSINRKYPCGKCEFRAFNNKKLEQHIYSEH